MRNVSWVLLSVLPALAGQRTMTLKEAVELASRQSPEVVLARLDEQRAALEAQAVREPMLPRLITGSGLAYSGGMPMSIEGATPAVVQAKAVRALWNRPQGYQVAAARETARAAAAGTAAASSPAGSAKDPAAPAACSAETPGAASAAGAADSCSSPLVSNS